MSKTKLKNRQKVCDALLYLTVTPDKDGYKWKWHPISAIAGQAGLARPTVVRYIDQMCKDGHLVCVVKNGCKEYKIKSQ